MTTITDADLGNKYWATSEQVSDRFKIEVGNQNPDHETRIVEATDAIQADWSEATGKSIPDDLPADVPELLQYATAYLAASQAHLHFAQNVSGENNRDERHVFLEDQSQKMFDRWVSLNVDFDDEGDTADGDDVGGLSGVIGGADRSPIYRGDD